MSQPTSLADRLKTVTIDVNPVQHQVSTYQQTRNTDIQTALVAQGFDKLMQPDQTELMYVNSVFQNKNFNDIDKVTFTAVQDIGKTEFADLNAKLKKFTNAMSGVETAGMLDMLDDLSKDVSEVDLEGIWTKACNAKAPLWVRFIAMFKPSFVKKFTSEQLTDLQELLSGRGNALEVKLTKIERELENKQHLQEQNIKTLESTFDVYYNSFMQLRKQFALVVYLEHSYKNQLEQYKVANAGLLTELTVNKKIQDYERTFEDIQNKRLILHKTLLQLPITVQQNNNLIKVCKSLMKEAENTRQSSFPMIRSNLLQIGVAISAQKSLLSTEAAQNLEMHSTSMATKVTNDLTVKAELLSSQARLREAESVTKRVAEVAQFKNHLVTVKAEAKQNIDQASALLLQATEDVKNILEI